MTDVPRTYANAVAANPLGVFNAYVEIIFGEKHKITKEVFLSET